MPTQVLTLGGAVGRYFETYMRHTKGPAAGTPFVLEPWEQEFVDDFYSVDEQGRRIYRLGVLGIPRGNGKTPLAAGLGLYELTTRRDSPDIFAAAGSKPQGRLLLDFARAFVDGGDLRKWIRTNANLLTVAETAGVMRVLSAAGALQHGLSVSAALVDELHAFTTHAQEELYAALWSALHKREDAFLLAITTAGFDKDTILGRIYEQSLELEDQDDSRLCLRIRRDVENGVLFYWYGIPETLQGDWQNEELWRAANPASWVSLRDLRRQLGAPGFDELDFQRLHLNMWTQTRESWLPTGCWAGLASAAKIPDGAGTEIYVAIDAAYSYDTTAVAWAWLDKARNKILVDAHVWTVRDDAPGERVAGDTLDNEELVEPFVHALGDRFRIKEVVYDPRYFSTEGRHLSKRFNAAPLEQASGEMVDAVNAFYRNTAGVPRIEHTGNEILAKHVAAIAGRKTDGGWRISKKNSSRPIDAGVAAVMCCWRASRESPETPTITWL